MAEGIKIHEVAGNSIHFTSDYSIFEWLPDNRDVEDNRKAKISASITDVGYIPAPIVVNERMQVIDGQGRLSALSELGIPVAYIIVPGLGIRECISMNISGTQWKDEDYIKSYKEQGNENYVRLYELLYVQFPGQFGLSNVLMSTIGKPYDSNSIRRGTVTVSEEGGRRAYDLLEFVSNINKGLDGTKLSSKMVNAIIFAVQVDGVDPDRLSRLVERNYNQTVKSGDMIGCLDWLTYIYNQGVARSIPRIRFENEYEDATANKNSWYAKKWGWVESHEAGCKQDEGLVIQTRFEIKE